VGVDGGAWAEDVGEVAEEFNRGDVVVGGGGNGAVPLAGLHPP